MSSSTATVSSYSGGQFPTDGVGRPDHSWFVADHGAHVLAWDVDDRPVLWAAPDALWEVAEDDQDGGVIRGGIPVCLPWFGGGGHPAHGTARRQAWERVRGEVDSGQVLAEHWIVLGALEASQLVTMSATALELSLTVTNNDSQPRRVEAAHHTYLAVGRVDDCTVTGVDGAQLWDAVADTIGVHRGDLAITPSTDKVFTTVGPLGLIDRAWGRQISISTEGFTQAVVWNSRPLVDPGLGVTNDRWNEFVCVESACIRELAPTLEPGESRTFVTRIGVQSL